MTKKPFLFLHNLTNMEKYYHTFFVLRNHRPVNNKCCTTIEVCSVVFIYYCNSKNIPPSTKRAFSSTYILLSFTYSIIYFDVLLDCNGAMTTFLTLYRM